MKKFEITLQLEKVREANEQWRVALARKNADVEWMMRRLLHEAARAFMSPEEVAAASGFTVKRIRILMRSAGLDPRSGKNLLSKQAAETLAENAELMGVEPQHMDLTSPLAYLPMGEEMRRSLQDQLLTSTTVDDIEFAPDERRVLEVAYLLWQFNQGYITAEDRAVGRNWFLDDLSSLHEDDLAERPGWIDAARDVIAIVSGNRA